MEYPSSQPRHRRSDRYHRQRRRIRLVRQLGLASLPFVIFLAGLTLVSIGFFSYVEQESVLAMFITQRDDTRNFTVLAVGETTQSIDAVPTSPDPVSGEAAAPSQESTFKPKSIVQTDTATTGASGRLVIPFYYLGDLFGVINIPSVDIAVNVYNGDSETEFRKGVGHYAMSYYPGQDGNILVAGHRTSFFRNFEYLEIGDMVYFDTTYGRFVYTIDEFKIIDGTDQSVAKDTSHEQLTMYTCYPFTYFGNAPQRYVVICSLKEKRVNT